MSQWPSDQTTNTKKQETQLSLTGRAQSIIQQFFRLNTTVEIIAHIMLWRTYDRCHWLRTLYALYFWDTVNETVSSSWNDLQVWFKVIGNVVLRHIARTFCQLTGKVGETYVLRRRSRKRHYTLVVSMYLSLCLSVCLSVTKLRT